MKRYLFFMLALTGIVFTFASCSSSDEQNDSVVDFTLSQKNVELFYNGEAEIGVNGVDARACNLETSDDFIAEASSHSGKIRINGNHVGNATITVSYKGENIDLPVVVKPVINYIGTPVIDFGATSASIKKKETSTYNTSYDGRIDYVDQTLTYPVYHRYGFTDGKLVDVLSMIDIPSLTKGYGTFFIQVTNSLRERYSYLDSYKGKYQTIYLFTFKNKYYIGARAANGNGGWYVYYAKTMGEVKEKLDINSSFSL